MLLKDQIDRNQPQYFISTEADTNTPWRQESSGIRTSSQVEKINNNETSKIVISTI